MKNMKRALRRHHVTRLKATRRFYWGRDLRPETKYLGMAVDTPCPCSCWGCGNPRRYFGEVTRREQIGCLALAEGTDEVVTDN